MKYAQRTKVPEGQSRTEIERTLKRYGASSFMYGWSGRNAVIAFRAKSRSVRFELPLPEEPGATKEKQAQSDRQRWRALALAIKAKLETVESGISSFENEFMAFIVLPNGMNVSEWLSPQIEEAYRDGKSMPLLLPGGKEEA